MMSIIQALVTFLGETEHFCGRIGALRWSILVGKQKHNVQKPIPALINLVPRSFPPNWMITSMNPGVMAPDEANYA